MAVTGPTLARRRLGMTLREMRKAAGKSQSAVTSTGIISHSALNRLEGGEVRVDVAKAAELARLYGADEATVEMIKEHAKRTRGRGWWEDYGEGLQPGFVTYVGLEADASVISTYQAFVPGILQSEDYARAMEHGSRRDGDADAIDRTVALRMERREAALQRGVSIVAVLDEAALMRQVGGVDVLAAQIDYLRELTDLPHVKILVLPWQAGAHPGAAGRFTLLEFDDPRDAPIAYVETYIGAHYLEEPSRVDGQRDIFSILVRVSRPIEEYVS